MNDQGERPKAHPTKKRSGYEWWHRLIGYVQRENHGHKAEKQNENTEQNALRWTTRANIAIAVFTIFLAGISYFTLMEMKQSGVDSSGQMNQMIEKYRQQIAQISRQADQTQELAAQMKVQAEQTKTIAAQAVAQANAAKSFADTASRQLELTDRPWIKIVGAVANHPVIFHSTGNIKTHGNDFINLGIKVIVQNVGKSAALDVVTRADVIFVSMKSGAPNNPFTYPIAMQKALCSKPADAGMPINLFPGEDNGGQSGDDHDISTTGKTFIVPHYPDSLARLMPFFVGCVDYRIGVSGKVHQSGFIYSVEQAIPGSANRGMLILGDDIPMTDIRMERFPFGGFDAN